MGIRVILIFYITEGYNCKELLLFNIKKGNNGKGLLIFYITKGYSCKELLLF